MNCVTTTLSRRQGHPKTPLVVQLQQARRPHLCWPRQFIGVRTATVPLLLQKGASLGNSASTACRAPGM